MVTVDEVRGQEDGDDEGEEQSRGNDGLTHVVTYRLWERGWHAVILKQKNPAIYV